MCDDKTGFTYYQFPKTVQTKVILKPGSVRFDTAQYGTECIHEVSTEFNEYARILMYGVEMMIGDTLLNCLVLKMYR